MGDVMDFPSRTSGRPWYRDETLVGDNAYPTGQVPHSRGINPGESPLFTGFARILPADIFVPQDQVIAFITAAIEWDKPLRLSWMQMDFDPFQGCEVPLQHHADGAAVCWRDTCWAAFGVILPDSTEQQLIQTDCVTNIFLDLFAGPTVTKHRQSDGTVVVYTRVEDKTMRDDGAVKASEPYVLDDGTKVPVWLYEDGSRWMPIVVSAGEMPEGCQVDG